MSQLTDYVDLISAGLKIARASRDVWQEANQAQRKTWLTDALTEAFSGIYFTPKNHLLALVQQVSNYQNLNQFFLENAWAKVDFDAKQADWDIMVSREGNPAMWRNLAIYGGGALVIFGILYLIYKYKKRKL